jgi:GNAT superfamily N-acetyltransferase
VLTVRRIRQGESKLYKKLRLKSLRDSPGAFGSTYESALKRIPESWTEQADGSSRGSDRATLLAFVDDRPAGLAALYRLDSPADVGELVQVWVPPEFRRQGVAVALMDNIFIWATKNNFRAIAAGIMADNAGAMNFYQNYGFTPETGIVLNCPGDAAVLIKDVI